MTPMARHIPRFLAAGLVFAAACDPVEHGSAGDTVGVVEHSVAMSRTNALIAEARVSLSHPAAVYVEYDNPLAGRYRTRLGTAATEHVIPIVRLRPETTYDYTAFTVRGTEGSDAVRAAQGSFTTDALPEPLASVFTMATGRSSQPLILSDYRMPDAGSSYFVFWDEVGAVVWYLRVKDAGPVVRSLQDESFVFIPWVGGLRQFTALGKVIDLAGDTLAQWPPERGIPKSHHELIPLDGSHILLPLSLTHSLTDSLTDLADDFGSGDQAKRIIYDNLVIWHSATGRMDEVWNAREAWDMLDPAQHWEPVDSDGDLDWTHLNSVRVNEHGNLLLSFRSRSQVVSLTPDYEIEWQLHGPDSDYEFPDPTDRFYQQHTASQLANGNILLFDNGKGRPDDEGGEYSRVLELRLDDAAGTAVKTWEYRPNPDIFAPYVSSAFRLDRGNTLVNFGKRDRGAFSGAPLVVVEVNANGEDVFRVETVQLHEWPLRYRARGGIEAIYGETMLRPPTAFEQRPPPVRLHYERMTRLATGTFDLYMDDGYLVYAKAPCTLEDVALPFLLHVRPKKQYVLRESRRDLGFDNRDFNFFQQGLRWQGKCHAELRLPEYEIGHIATGQFVAEGDVTDASAAAAWRVEIPLGTASNELPLNFDPRSRP